MCVCVFGGGGGGGHPPLHSYNIGESCTCISTVSSMVKDFTIIKIIGASLSEPHTREFGAEISVCLYVCIRRT